jgi:hypothetical protein
MSGSGIMSLAMPTFLSLEVILVQITVSEISSSLKKYEIMDL